MLTATVSSKGQVVIPVELRRQLGIQPGDIVTFSQAADGSTTLTRRETWDELSARFSSWIKPGTEPLEDVHAYYEQRQPRL